MFLEKEDFSLYYEVRGEGEPLLLVHGIIVDSGLYEESARLLSRSFRVITFDRRGNSRSAFYEKKDRAFSMDEQADDIKDLLDELSVDQALVFGASAGAAVSQFFLLKYPERVKHLIMYEPATRQVVASVEESSEPWIQEVKGLIERKKYNRALLQFSDSIGAPDPKARPKDPDQAMREYGNVAYAMNCELFGTLYYRPDLDGMRALRDKITIAAGKLNPDTVYHQISVELAKQLNKELVLYSGGHNFPCDRPEEFAESITKTFQEVTNGKIK